MPSTSTAFLSTLLFTAIFGGAAQAADGSKAWTEEAVETQVFLDRASFGPGKIDGLPGEFTDKALAAYRSAHPEAKDLKLPNGTPTFIDYHITDSDVAQVGPLGKTPEEQARQKSMPYPTLVEELAEKFHADADFIRVINPDKKLEELKAGDVVQVPNVEPFEIEKVQVMHAIPKDGARINREIVVDTMTKFISVSEGGKVLAIFPISPGSDHLPAPKGTWKIESVTTLPVFRWDEKMLQHGERGEEFHLIQPGARNPVGILWVQFLDKPGIGIHGTSQPDTIGRSYSHGCIRLANWDAARLSRLISTGGTVAVR